ncbi:MAG: hypothetical protein IT210_15715 [Armatimonadetes bacterium]|nr:hypothetical protein [Armatimonadota bacterium]
MEQAIHQEVAYLNQALGRRRSTQLFDLLMNRIIPLQVLPAQQQLKKVPENTVLEAPLLAPENFASVLIGFYGRFHGEICIGFDRMHLETARQIET